MCIRDRRWDVSKNATCGRDEERKKKGQKLSCVKLAICPDHPRRRRPLKFRVPGRVREVVIYFKFHENRSRGLGAVGGRKSPSPIDKAHGLYNSLYYRTSRDIYRAFMVSTVHKDTNDILAELGAYENASPTLFF